MKNQPGYAPNYYIVCPRCKKQQKTNKPYPPWGYLHHCDCGQFITDYSGKEDEPQTVIDESILEAL